MGTATIIAENGAAKRVAACAGRISTTAGSALDIFRAPADEQKDGRLILKVLSSGHRTIIEHHGICVAFDDVSVLAEQFVIEHRLAAYTVKSRRYVDYSSAGFLLPKTIPLRDAAAFTERTEYLFDLYGRMVASGVPREDARFVLPYCFHSNFYCTMDARELAHLICSMAFGRGKDIPEIRELGESLKAQFDALYPSVLDPMAAQYENWSPCGRLFRLQQGRECAGEVSIVSSTQDPASVLRDAVRFTGRFDPHAPVRDIARALAQDARPRELEMLQAQFSIRHMSLACLTHLTRHRMLSLLVPDVREALASGDYLLPASVEATEGIRDEYVRAFEEQTEFASQMLRAGMSPHEAGYMALAGHMVNARVSMNGREMLHFFKLRTCRRAQWEIRAIANSMLEQLCALSDIYSVFGPSCAVTGSCPEGRLSCGRPFERR